MALLSGRAGAGAGMPDYDDICEDYHDHDPDYTYDELTDQMSICSGSVNDILDHLSDEVLRDSGDLDNLDLDDMTIPDVINIPAVNGTGRYQGGYSNGRHQVGVNQKTVSYGGKNTGETNDSAGARLLRDGRNISQTENIPRNISLYKLSKLLSFGEILGNISNSVFVVNIWTRCNKDPTETWIRSW